jgi:uncharacterized protein (TIGR02246 family)
MKPWKRTAVEARSRSRGGIHGSARPHPQLITDDIVPYPPSGSHIVAQRVLAVCAVGLITLGTMSMAYADEHADKAAIVARLQHWATAFNRRDAAGVCDLFAPDLISTVPNALNAGRRTVCDRLSKLLAKPGLTLQYHPDIQEIILSGDIAVVRLIWTLTTEKDGRSESDREAGMDVFRRQSDGRWSILRFMAFSTSGQLN